MYVRLVDSFVRSVDLIRAAFILVLRKENL